MQRTDEWMAARAGCITASRMADLMAGGRGLTRKRLLNQLALERITGQALEAVEATYAMKRGIELEDRGRAAYEMMYAPVEQVGFIEHPTLPWCGASPDGLVGEEGLVEIKCPLVHTHVETIRTETIDRKYLLQMQWQMECTGRKWCDFVSYCPILGEDPTPEWLSLELYVQRVFRDEDMIAEMRAAAELANEEIEEIVEALRRRLDR